MLIPVLKNSNIIVGPFKSGKSSRLLDFFRSYVDMDSYIVIYCDYDGDKDFVKEKLEDVSFSLQQPDVSLKDLIKDKLEVFYNFFLEMNSKKSAEYKLILVIDSLNSVKELSTKEYRSLVYWCQEREITLVSTLHLEENDNFTASSLYTNIITLNDFVHETNLPKRSSYDKKRVSKSS